MALSFNRDLRFRYGHLEPVAPGIRRIVAPNASHYTLHGTGTYVIGQGAVAVIDPGPADPEHIDALLGGLQGESVHAILITHTHLDHSPGAALLAERTGAPICGCAPHARHADTFTGEAGGDLDYRPDRQMADAEVVSGPGWAVEAVATPGHTANHLCFALRGTGVLFSGDHVMGWSTTVVSPPDGNMRAYMHSLRRLAGRADSVYWPTHGPAINAPQAFVQALHEHREAREKMVLEALQGGAGTIPEIVDRIYAGLDPRLVRPAQRTTWAHLLKLIEEGRARAAERADLEGHYTPA